MRSTRTYPSSRGRTSTEGRVSRSVYPIWYDEECKSVDKINTGFTTSTRVLFVSDAARREGHRTSLRARLHAHTVCLSLHSLPLRARNRSARADPIHSRLPLPKQPPLNAVCLIRTNCACCAILCGCGLIPSTNPGLPLAPRTRILNRHRRPLGYIDVSALKKRWEKGEINPVRPVLVTYHFPCRTFDMRRPFLRWIGYRMTKFRT